MISNITEQYIREFYEWERLGRGWQLYEDPVDIEPYFIPFYRGHSREPYVDNGRVPRLWERIWRLVKGKPKLAPPPIPQAYVFETQDLLQTFVLTIPKEYKYDLQEAAQFLVMLSSCERALSFEIIATHTAITLQFCCRQSEATTVEHQLKAYFPNIIITTNPEQGILDNEQYVSIYEMGLTEEFMRPLRCLTSRDGESLTGIFGALEYLEHGERAIVQVLFKGTVDPWASSILASVSDGAGRSFFADAPEMPKLAQEKISSPLVAATIRVIGQGASEARSRELAERLGTIISKTTQSQYNSLNLLPNNGYLLANHVRDVQERQSSRLGILLNLEELLTLVHIPEASLSTKLTSVHKKTKAAPSTAGQGITLGTNTHRGIERTVIVSTEQRLRHTHVIGATGTGKSNLLHNLIDQDIQSGKGITVLDPHGDLIDTILRTIPEHRYKDVVLVDPSDTDYPVGFNILSAHSDIEKEILSSDLVSTFRRFSTSWGDQMNSVLANAILAFVESSEGGTLLDLRRFLVEKEFREQHLKTVSDQSVLYYWLKEYPLIKGASIGPILTRLDTFLRPKLIRNMVGQKRSLDFEKILDSGKILLIKLPQGLIGEDNSYLLGTLFISKLYQAAMARQAKSAETRREFYCYIDEFQNFLTPSMASILSGARKYKFGLVMAHQDLQQLAKADIDLANAVLSNTATRVCFRVGDSDAKRLEGGFSDFEAQDLQNLLTGEAIARIEKAEQDFNLSIPQFKKAHQSNIDAIINLSRQSYALHKEQVESAFSYFDTKPVVEAINPLQQQIIQPKVEIKEVPVATIQEIVQEAVTPKIERTSNELEKVKEDLVKRKELTKHRYLQNLIKKLAQANGYIANIETPTKDGNGRADVSLEKDGKRIACEVGITTTKQWETHNVQKCLDDGYDTVIAIAESKQEKQKMRNLAEENIKDMSRILVMEVDELVLFISRHENSKEVKRTKGYRVKINYG